MRVLMGLMALAALGLAPAAAGAASVSYTQSYPGPSDGPQDPPGFVPTNWDGTAQSVTLPQFDPALGTLTAVDLSLYGAIRSSGTLTNMGSDTAHIQSYSATTDITLLAPDTPAGWTPGDPGALLTVSPVLFNITTPLTLAPGQSYAFGADTSVAASDSDGVSATDLSPFAGAGSLEFPLFTAVGVSPNYVGGDPEVVPATAARAEATVTYTFDPAATDVPEPPSAPLLGVGLLGLGLLRKWV